MAKNRLDEEKALAGLESRCWFYEDFGKRACDAERILEEGRKALTSWYKYRDRGISGFSSPRKLIGAQSKIGKCLKRTRKILCDVFQRSALCRNESRISGNSDAIQLERAHRADHWYFYFITNLHYRFYSEILFPLVKISEEWDGAVKSVFTENQITGEIVLLLIQSETFLLIHCKRVRTSNTCTRTYI